MQPTTRSAEPLVAIAVPIYRLPLAADEQLSLRHLERHLGRFDRYAVIPEGLITGPVSLRGPRGLEPITFDPAFFTGTAAYSRLLLAPAFYRCFAAYEYLLIYQLDCLVFDDALLHWCAQGWDYIGAPWLRDPQRPERGFSRVGNGGLSLRRVSSFLNVLSAAAPRATWFGAPLPDLPPWALLRRAGVLRAAGAGAARYAASYTLNEDRFWSDRARLFLPEFRIPSPEQALGFAFEQAPRFCFERHGRRLPMGCHAWRKWDEAFWRDYLERE